MRWFISLLLWYFVIKQFIVFSLIFVFVFYVFYWDDNIVFLSSVNYTIVIFVIFDKIRFIYFICIFRFLIVVQIWKIVASQWNKEVFFFLCVAFLFVQYRCDLEHVFLLNIFCFFCFIICLVVCFVLRLFSKTCYNSDWMYCVTTMFLQ